MIVPAKASFRPGEPIQVPVPGPVLKVSHLGRPVSTVRARGGTAVLPELPEGGYALRCGAEAGAVDVLADPCTRPRYGFVTSCADDDQVTRVARVFLRFHLTAASFVSDEDARDHARLTTALRQIGTELPVSVMIGQAAGTRPTLAEDRRGIAADAVHLRPEPGQDQLRDLAQMTARVPRPVTVATPLPFFGRYSQRSGAASVRLLLATLFAHGATPYLIGDADRLLTDLPAASAPITPATVDLLGRWYDFLVANGDLLFAQECAAPGDMHAGEDFRLVGDVLISDDARPGTIWQQIRHTGYGPVIHLINLIGQPDARWTTPKIDCRPIRGLTLRLRQHGSTPSTVWVGDPDRGPDLQPLTVTPDGHGHVIAALPPLGKWQLIHLSGRSL